MQRFALALFAALSLAAFDASAVDVTIAAPVTPGQGGSCPKGYQLSTCKSSGQGFAKVTVVQPGQTGGCPRNFQLSICRTTADCLSAFKAGKSMCLATKSRRRTGGPVERWCPVSPDSKVMKRC